MGFWRIVHGDAGKHAFCQRVLMLTMAPMSRGTNRSVSIVLEMSFHSFLSIGLCVVVFRQRQIRRGQGERHCGRIRECRRKGSHVNYVRCVEYVVLDVHI